MILWNSGSSAVSKTVYAGSNPVGIANGMK